MLNKAQLLQVFEAGLLEVVADEVRRYGVFTHDARSFESEGFYAGETRLMVIHHHGLEWRVEMLNGAVREVEWQDLPKGI